MKTPLIMAAAALLAVGCDQQRQASNDRTRDSEKNVQKTVREAKAEVDRQAKAQKEMLNAEARAAQAKLDAEKARAKVESASPQARVDAASQNIREAAGAAGAKVQTEVGAANSSRVPAPAETGIATPTIADSDQTLGEQVRIAVLRGATANVDESKSIQVTVVGGTVTLKGSVKSDAEKSQAESTAKAVPGVASVDNQLEVKAE